MLARNYKDFIEVKKKRDKQALEGTGSLIFDSVNKKIYCSLSERADKELAEEFLEQFNSHSKNPYSLVLWHSKDQNGNPIYHTNVVMASLKDHTVLVSESIHDLKEREKVIEEITMPSLNRKPKKIIDLNYQEMMNMAGNMIMVENNKGEPCVVMSEKARKALRPHNLSEIENNYRIISSNLETIEYIGGGSARCMIAELF
eukprot:CAMPEP_0202957366 /NCGR_PEP_ID=MMETSP1396-20130829/1777_1 /ASSEMBLY_ACC=CAM_ASM_000872 /TAXON_ID= /ORGANISM="Pseudokeronopsis sp., Strain Brazil" /LENGTH=200 /DNA_ID=CAMNT_0049674809 /DNA_START=426 /DNA_END=1028 /DNA_ORIENTATION=+